MRRAATAALAWTHRLTPGHSPLAAKQLQSNASQAQPDSVQPSGCNASEPKGEVSADYARPLAMCRLQAGYALTPQATRRQSLIVCYMLHHQMNVVASPRVFLCFWGRRWPTLGRPRRLPCGVAQARAARPLAGVRRRRRRGAAYRRSRGVAPLSASAARAAVRTSSRTCAAAKRPPRRPSGRWPTWRRRTASRSVDWWGMLPET